MFALAFALSLSGLSHSPLLPPQPIELELELSASCLLTPTTSSVAYMTINMYQIRTRSLKFRVCASVEPPVWATEFGFTLNFLFRPLDLQLMVIKAMKLSLCTEGSEHQDNLSSNAIGSDGKSKDKIKKQQEHTKNKWINKDKGINIDG